MTYQNTITISVGGVQVTVASDAPVCDKPESKP